MRVSAFVDGLNLYHALRQFHGLLWLDIRKLILQQLRTDDSLDSVLYFTAYCPWDPEKVKRHKAYITALSSTGVKIELGHFKPCSKYFLRDSNTIDRQKCIPADLDETLLPERLAFKTFSEKETDVALGVSLYHFAASDLFDTAIVVSGDSDLSPAIRLVKKHFPDKCVHFMTPQGNPSRQIRRLCSSVSTVTEQIFRECQFPAVVQIKGNKTTERPMKWAPTLPEIPDSTEAVI